MRTTYIVVCFCIFGICSVFGYDETHPSFKFKDGPLHYVNFKELADQNIPAFIEKDEGPVAATKVYKFDIDGNGTQDYIVFLWGGGSPLMNMVQIYLNRKEGGYQKITLPEDAYSGIEDVVSIKDNGKYQIIYCDLYGAGKHDYITYSIYEFKNYRLVNADKKYKGFPKFVWFTNKNNDQDTVHLTAQEREQCVKEKDNSIVYSLIK